jgi:enamine deaminase RidA (YjgF/YER057c/UK114 family)
VLCRIDAAVRHEGGVDATVAQTVFLRDAGQAEECRRIAAGWFGERLPVTSYVLQPPCDGAMLSVESLSLAGEENNVQIGRLSEELAIARWNGLCWVYCAPRVSSAAETAAHEGTLGALGRARWLLARAGVGFDRVVRTWFYLGGIVAEEGPSQRYQELNRARNDFYWDIGFFGGLGGQRCNRPAYPASTGIGAQGRGVAVSAVALMTARTDVAATPLENPRQTAAYDYAAHYSPHAPQFSRAVALSCGDDAAIFISGTASITDSESRHLGNAAAQAGETLANIEALVSAPNLARHGLPRLGASWEDVVAARVYVKRPEDYPAVRAVCEERLGAAPVTYVTADVCRPELLVEIEGIAFSRRPAPAPAVPGLPGNSSAENGLRQASLAPVAADN